MLRFAITTVLAWAGGLAVYVATLLLFFQQRVSGSDLRAVAFWCGVTAAVAALFLYMPLLAKIRKMRSGYRPRLLFGLIPFVLSVVPSATIMFVWGGGVRDIFSVEGRMFVVFFAAFGAIFGVGYTLQRSHARE